MWNEIDYFTIPQVWEQAITDPRSVVQNLPKGISIIANGVKLMKFQENIEMFNMNKGGDYFKELDEDEYALFHEGGWKVGLIKLAISNCLFKLDLIEKRIQNEVNTRKNDKHIQNLKNRREKILKKYTTHQTKLNKIK
tara:strand:+ start:815 stop:1228 length:414 start_codon:yes stop_codon:yes gene_type:complete